MNKISRYILRSSIAPFFFGICVVIFLFFIQALDKHLDKLIGKGLENIVIFQFIIYSIAWMVILAVPLAVLFASLMAFGNLANNNEITVIKASGGSLIKMMLPMFIAASFVTCMLFLYDDHIVPETNHKLKVLLYDIQRKKPTLAIEEGQFSNEIDGYTILARKTDTSTNILGQVTIYDNKNMQLNRTINAESCQIMFSKDMKRINFILHNGEIFQSQNKSVKNYRQIKFDDYTLSVSASGFGFEQTDSGTIGRSDRELCVADMQEIVNKTKKDLESLYDKLQADLSQQYNYLLYGVKLNTHSDSSNDNVNINNPNIQSAFSENTPEIRRINNRHIASDFNFQIQHINNQITQSKEKISMYGAEIQKKYAIPFACLIFIFIGCPLGVITKGGNFGLSATITLGFFILYWSSLIAGEKLADRMILDPTLSMWLGNIIIGIVGIFLTIRANNESLSFGKMFRIKNKLRKHNA